MTQLTWDAPGSRFYETGVDRGVLYVDDVGFSWSGLISVTEKSSGGEPQPYYVDGFKYLNLAASEEFEATIEAYSSPAEFGVCDGNFELYNGLFVTGQRRKQFGLAYRTRIGSDMNADLGYKLHIIYNALAAPTSRANKTTGDTVDPTILTWEITTTPPRATGIKPMAHIVLDSRRAHPDLLIAIEEAIYGDAEADARLPTQTEIFLAAESYA